MKDNKDVINKILADASAYKRHRVTESDLNRFLTLLSNTQPIDLWDYTRISDQYIRVILSFLYSLEKRGYVSVDGDGKIQFTPEGRRLTKSLNIRKKPSPFKKVKPWCGLELTTKYLKILDIIRDLYREITPQNRYDQAPLVPEAAVYKVAYAIQRGDVTNKDVVCVGDDDLTSIIFALSGLPRSVLAIDIDKYLLETIEEYAEKNNLPIKTLRHDLRNPIPDHFKKRFDLFMTEPPDTVSGITLFVSRGVEFINNGGVGYCGISLTACPPLGLLEMQKNFTRMNLIITDRLVKYSDYPPHRTELKHVEVPDCYDEFYPPKKVWYVSDLVRLRATAKTRPLFKEYKGKLSDYRGDAIHFQ